MFNERSFLEIHCCLKTIIPSNMRERYWPIVFLIDLAPLWRHSLGMLAEVEKDDALSRQNLRLKNSIWKAIDDCCAVRAGAVSRNTWITEAIIEKLDKDAEKASAFPKRGANHA
jgi:hypothetical protein